KDKLLQIKLVLENTSSNPMTKVEHRGWGVSPPMGAAVPQLTDNTGKAYKCITSLGPKAQVELQPAKLTIFPSKYAVDLVLFQAPALDQMEFVTLELPAANFGGNGSVKFRILKEMVINKNSAPPKTVPTPTPVKPMPPVVDAKELPELRKKLKSPDK